MRYIVLLPLLDSIVLASIVGALVVYIDNQHNPSAYDGILTGEADLAQPVTLFLIYWVPIVIIVLVVELVIHHIVRAVERRQKSGAKG